MARQLDDGSAMTMDDMVRRRRLMAELMMMSANEPARQSHMQTEREVRCRRRARMCATETETE